MAKDWHQPSQELPNGILPLLVEYADLATLKLLDKLPPLRYVQQKIDFVLRSNLQNIPIIE